MKRLGCILPVLAVIGLLCVAAAGWIWLNARPQPENTEEQLFNGVTYIREVRNTPRPMVIHIVKVSLQAEGVHTIVTPGDKGADRTLTARTTSEFLNEFNVQVAINGDGFDPWYSRGPLDYYPHSGDLVNPLGFSASRGTVYWQGNNGAPTLYISKGRRARFNTPIGNVYNAISGGFMVLRQGTSIEGLDDSIQPRTGVAVDQSESRLILVVIDGRQPGYSEGATLYELAEIMRRHGGFSGMSLDGGGSSTLVVEGPLGTADVLNTPIHSSIPGRERPVGNHLGIIANK